MSSLFINCSSSLFINCSSSVWEITYLCSTIKQTNFKHNNVFKNKFVNIKLDLSIYNIIFYMYTCWKIYLYRLEIGLHKIIICNLLIIQILHTIVQISKKLIQTCTKSVVFWKVNHNETPLHLLIDYFWAKQVSQREMPV